MDFEITSTTEVGPNEAKLSENVKINYKNGAKWPKYLTSGGWNKDSKWNFKKIWGQGNDIAVQYKFEQLSWGPLRQKINSQKKKKINFDKLNHYDASEI